MDPLLTDRLRLRPLADSDAEFILRLVNEPLWLRYIGDKQVHSLDDAIGYIQGHKALQDQRGFSLLVVETLVDAAPIGLSGLIKRDMLDDVDIGFAFLPEHSGQSFAFEASERVLKDARQRLGLSAVAAITTPDNHRSIALLERLGLSFVRQIETPDGETLSFYRIAFD